nr:FAD-dependent oxidoreductase [Metallosphaera hakonensis]
MKVAIIGGGIIGLMTAYYLAKEGTNVTVFDPSPGKFSIHAAGLIEPYRFDRINTSAMIYKMLKYMKRGVTEVRQLNRLWIRELLLNLNKSPPEEAWETMRAMAKFSLDAYSKFAEEKNDFDYANDGLLEIYSKKDDLEKGVEEEKRSPFSPKTEIVDVPGFAGGIYFPELSRIATEKFTRRIISEVENMKVKFQQKKGRARSRKIQDWKPEI